MQIVQSGILLAFEITLDSPSLDVAISVYDVTSGSAVLVSGPTAMDLIVGNTYVGKFTPTIDGKSYLILKAVYTDGTFATLSPDYSQGSETISVQPQQSAPVDNSPAQIVGSVSDGQQLSGSIED